jgi:type II secretory pathway pseudopilin PulG
VFEVVIVAIGVFLGLAVNDWQGNVQRRQLASEARSALRSEIVANRDLVFTRLRITAKLYALVSAHPDQAGRYVFERRNQPLLLSDTAWRLALDSGAARWLAPKERASITGVYAEQDHIGDLAKEEMSRWTELAAFAGLTTSQEAGDARDRAVRVWLAYAQRVQLGECIQLGRYERALGSTAELARFFDFCVRRDPDEDPSILYREWQKRGWISGDSPRPIARGLTAPL